MPNFYARMDQPFKKQAEILALYMLGVPTFGYTADSTRTLFVPARLAHLSHKSLLTFSRLLAFC